MLKNKKALQPIQLFIPLISCANFNTLLKILFVGGSVTTGSKRSKGSEDSKGSEGIGGAGSTLSRNVAVGGGAGGAGSQLGQ